MTPPDFFYGTAWKELRTAPLVTAALAAGFRAIDTANQRKHYFEAAVGEALRDAYETGVVTRDDLYLQTKFTHVAGQDHRRPYDPAAPVAEQVASSFASSLEHLGTDTLDSYVLHGPSTPVGLAPADLAAWDAMEEIHRAGGTRTLGVSNVRPAQLAALLEHATVAPTWVQNRCFARTGWDREVRAICRANGLTYQGFSLLTANRAELAGAVVRDLAADLGATIPQLVFAFCGRLGMARLTGTSDPGHMAEDLAADGFELTDAAMRTLETISG